ncbi:hypothetical protein L3Y34_011144 [Caenorhabditis briggsae]|uniref:DEgenerin Like n=1 Tax=Caenorhabditis briggsae TaxID=6238 RepID=A0AAE8ZP74_CAEBR|nr:hypothetical protein L3Y34_011144 [Caenorhabditis briggsae]
MTSVSFGGSDSRFQSLDRAPGYSDGASGFADIEDEENDIIDLDEESYEYLTNTYFRAGHDGCDEYTSLTTFHGMIRVFNSRNCPSLIFWCLVVTTCLVFYIMVCGAMIKSYSTQPSFLRINETKNVQFDTMIELCSEEKMKCYEIAREKEQMKCKEIDAHCVSIRFSTKTKIRLKKKGLYFKHGTEEDVHHLVSKPHTHHMIQLKVFQIQRLNLDRAQCVSNWHEIPWIPEDSKPDYHYSLKLCERIRYELTGKVEYLQYDFPCQPACLESQYKVSNSKLFHNSESVAITFSVFPVVTYMEETRQKTLVDILCFLGGASSLFMGCSCVTLMEMFVFLFKLVTNSVCSDEPPEPDDSFYEEKFRFEFSDHRNKRRYAICDRETMEKYLLSNNSMEVKSINLDKRFSVFSHSAIKKAPKLKTLKDNKNFEHIDIYDEGNREDLKEESSASPKDEYSVDYHDEKMDTVGEIPVENKRLLRPPLRRCSTATSYASHTSKGSSSLTTRSFAQVSQNRRMSRAFTRNMPMNDF